MCLTMPGRSPRIPFCGGGAEKGDGEMDNLRVNLIPGESPKKAVAKII